MDQTEKRLHANLMMIVDFVSRQLPGELFDRLSGPESPPETDHERFVLIARRIFGLGLPPWLVEQRFAATREALADLVPAKVAALEERDIAHFLSVDAALRNRAKVLAVRHNARVVQRLASEHGDLNRFAAVTIAQNGNEVRGQEALMQALQRELQFIGPISAARIAQELGVDVMVPHRSVLRFLHRLGAGGTDGRGAQELSERVAPEAWGPRRRGRLGAVLLAFATGRWSSVAVCNGEPNCGACPVAPDCPRNGVSGPRDEHSSRASGSQTTGSTAPLSAER